MMMSGWSKRIIQGIIGKPIEYMTSRARFILALLLMVESLFSGRSLARSAQDINAFIPLNNAMAAAGAYALATIPVTQHFSFAKAIDTKKNVFTALDPSFMTQLKKTDAWKINNARFIAINRIKQPAPGSQMIAIEGEMPVVLIVVKCLNQQALSNKYDIDWMCYRGRGKSYGGKC